MQYEAQATGPLILIAEDDPEIRDVLRWLLADAGYRLLLAVDGREAQDLAERERPALILLDLGMPLVSGPDFCLAYRDRGGVAPIVLLTAASPDDVTAAMGVCGAAAYIPKPFEMDALLATIARLTTPE